jgi:hypothetical protein
MSGKTGKFPETLFVLREEERDGAAYYAFQSVEALPEDSAGEKVATYAFVETGCLTVTKRVE